MNLLALRQWTVEFLDTAKSSPVLLLKRNALERGSLDSLPILSMHAEDSAKGVVLIEVRSPSGFKEIYSTRNVEDWPTLDPVVFKHFGIAPVFLPSDHEYQSWIPDRAQCVSHLDRDRLSLGQECERITPEPSKLKIFSKIIPMEAAVVTEWINDNDLAQATINIAPMPHGGYVVFYRAKEPID